MNQRQLAQPPASDFGLRFEALITDLLARFLNTSDTDTDREIEDAICRIAGLLNLDEGLLVQWGDDPTRSMPTHAWTAPGNPPAPKSPGTEVVPWIHGQSVLGKTVSFTRVDDLPPEAGADKEFFRKHGRKSLITLPLKVNGRVVGALVFASLRAEVSWPDEVLRRLQLVAEVFAGVLDRRAKKSQLEEEFQFESLLNDISSRFVSVQSDAVDAAIEDAQRLLCERLDLDRSSLFQCPAGEATQLVLTHVYQRPGLPFPVEKRPDPETQSQSYWRSAGPDSPVRTNRIDAKVMFPWFFAQLERSETVVVPDVPALGPEAAIDKQNLAAYGTLSTVVVPLSISGAWLGVLTFGAVRRRRAWPEMLVKRFQFIASVFTNAIARKRADEALRNSENRYRSIFEVSSDAVFLTDLETGRFLDANAAAEDMYGYSRDEFLRLRHLDLSAEPDNTLRSIAAGEKHVPVRLHRRKNGEVFPVELSASYGEYRGTKACVLSVRDVTERKRADDALRESEARLTLATESAGAGLWSVATETGYVWFSPRMREMFQFTPQQELKFETLLQAIPAEDHEQFLRVINEALAQGKDLALEHRIRLPDGSIRWISARGRSHAGGPGRPARLMGVSIDITEHKLAEQQLERSEQRFREMAENIREVFYAVDPRIPRIEYLSPAFEEVWGRSCQSRYDNPLSFFESIHPEDRARVKHVLLDTLGAGLVNVEYRIIRPDGSIRWIWDRAFPVLDEAGQVRRLTGLAEDITERKQAENRLRESEARFRMVADSAPVLIWMSGPDKLCDFFNKTWVDFTGRNMEQEMGHGWAEGVHPEDLAACLKAYNEAFDARRPFTIQYRLRRHDSEYRWISDHAVPRYEADGTFAGYIGSCADTTEVTQALKAVQTSEERFRTLIEHSPIAIGIGRKGLILYANRKYLDSLGYSNLEEIRGQQIVNHWVPECQEWIANLAKQFAQGRSEPADFEGTMLRKDGSTVPIHATVARMKLSDGPASIAFLVDITARKLAEKALRESVQRFRQVAENVGDFIWEVDTTGLYTYTSPSVEKILGYAPDELIGKVHFYDLLAPENREELKAAAFKIFAAKQPFRDFPNENVCKEGKRVFLETSGAPVLDEAGQLLGYRGADKDVTQRKLADDALRQSHAEIQSLKERLEAERDYLRTEIKVTQSFGEIIGHSQAIKRVLHLIEQVAPAECPVLICGETGTGKELIARAVHRLSPCKDRAMVKVNCAALPSTLIESELFGRERGAYTGALTSQAGRFEVADGSTLFLDEVGELSPEIQVKLLRVLQEGEFERLGSPRVRKVNVRVIAATNRDLAEEVRQGRFRHDLFYRLSVFPIKVPPLRDRVEDIPTLVSAFVSEFASRMGKKITKLPRSTMDALQHYSWPGNIRELRNVLEHAVILSNNEILRVQPLGESVPSTSKPTTLADNEREHILKAFEQTGGRIKGPHGAAKLLGINPATLYSRMRKLGIPSRSQRDDITP